MKFQAVHDRKSANIVAFLVNYALICDDEGKKQNNVSDNILQYLLTELLGLVKSGKFKRKESTIIWSKHVLYLKGHGRLLPYSDSKVFPEPNQTNADRVLDYVLFSLRKNKVENNSFEKQWKRLFREIIELK